jgi:hypothetical protein
MITFTRIPYADALHRARTQDRVVMIVVSILLMVLLALASALIQGVFS